MKVQILESVEVSDAQRVALAALIDGPGGRKRQATREELKDYIWRHGRDWALDLADDGGAPAPTPDEDLIGDLIGDDDDVI